MECIPFNQQHLQGVLALCEVEGWPSYIEDRDKTARVLTAPGVTTVVAADGHDVTGFAYLQSDGEIQAHLSLIAVSRSRRREGIGALLIREGLRRAGGTRVDLLSTEGADAFYQSLPHSRFPGYRLYPFNG
jgi:ribosomal protein S18 acetylase RimI-like enzyme